MSRTTASTLISTLVVMLLLLGFNGASAVAQDVASAPTGDATEAPSMTAEMPTEVPPTSTDLPTVAPLPPTELPVELIPTPTNLWTETPVQPTGTASSTPDTATLTPTGTSAPLLLPEPSMRLLVHDLFNNGDLSHWLLGEGWAVVPNETGFALQANSLNAAKLSLRVSSAGRYTASLDTRGVLLLFRGDALLGSAIVPSAAPGTWRTLRLSAVNDTVRVMLDEVEWIVMQDMTPLPPGEAEIMTGAAGANADGLPIIAPMLADDLFLFVPEAEYSLYPQPTEVPLPTLIPTEAATTVPTTVPTLVPTIPPVTNALPVVIEAESSDVSRWRSVRCPFGTPCGRHSRCDCVFQHGCSGRRIGARQCGGGAD